MPDTRTAVKEIRDDLLLVPLEPSSNHSNQDVQEHGGLGLQVVSRVCTPVYCQPEIFQQGSISRLFQPYGK